MLPVLQGLARVLGSKKYTGPDEYQQWRTRWKMTWKLGACRGYVKDFCNVGAYRNYRKPISSEVYSRYPYHNPRTAI